MKVTKSNKLLILKEGDFHCNFNILTGQLLSIANKQWEWKTKGLFIDVGCDEEFKLGLLNYHSLDPLHTWEMPPIDPINHPQKEWVKLFLGKFFYLAYMLFKARLKPSTDASSLSLLEKIVFASASSP